MHSFNTRCLCFTNRVASAHARLTSGWLASLCREGVEPSGLLRKVSVLSYITSPFPGLTLTQVGLTAGVNSTTSMWFMLRRRPPIRWLASGPCIESRRTSAASPWKFALRTPASLPAIARGPSPLDGEHAPFSLRQERDTSRHSIHHFAQVCSDTRGIRTLTVLPAMISISRS